MIAPRTHYVSILFKAMCVKVLIDPKQYIYHQQISITEFQLQLFKLFSLMLNAYEIVVKYLKNSTAELYRNLAVTFTRNS